MVADVTDKLIVTTKLTGVRVFISYSRADQFFVLPLAQRLRDRGFSVFLDTHNIPGGATWQHEIEAALEASQCCVACVGGSGIGQWHADEIQLARVIEKRKPGFVLVPVLLPGAAEDSVRGFLEIYNIVDLRTTDQHEAAFEALVNALRGTHESPKTPAVFVQSTIPKPMLNHRAIGCTMRIALALTLLVLMIGVGLRRLDRQLPASIATPVQTISPKYNAQTTDSMEGYDQWTATGCKLGATIDPSHSAAGALILKARQTATLRWTVQNTGTCVWAGHYIAQFTDAALSLSVPNTVTVSTNRLMPGSVITVSLQITAPNQVGTYHLLGRLRRQDDIIFGQPLSYTLQVVASPTTAITNTVP